MWLIRLGLGLWRLRAVRSKALWLLLLSQLGVPESAQGMALRMAPCAGAEPAVLVAEGAPQVLDEPVHQRREVHRVSGRSR